MARVTSITDRNGARSMALAGTLLVALLGLLAGCPPPGECVTDEDCPGTRECRPLRESDERVCVEPFTPPDAGPDEQEPVVIDELTADDDVVEAGGTTTLRWTTSHATSCAFNEGIGTVPTSGEHEVTITDTTTYTLSCQGHEGPALASVTVAVEVAVLGFDIDKEQANVGETLTLSWTTLGATACTASAPGLAPHEVPSAELVAGEVSFTAATGGEATLSCEGEPEGATASVPFEVAHISSFTATPGTTTAGGTVTLSWSGENVSNCAVEGVTDPDPSDDSVEVTVEETTGFTLLCEGFNGVEIEASVIVTVE